MNVVVKTISHTVEGGGHTVFVKLLQHQISSSCWVLSKGACMSVTLHGHRVLAGNETSHLTGPPEIELAPHICNTCINQHPHPRPPLSLTIKAYFTTKREGVKQSLDA